VEKYPSYMLMIEESGRFLHYKTHFAFAEDVLDFMRVCGILINESQWDSYRESFINKIYHADHETTVPQVESFIKTIAGTSENGIDLKIRCHWLGILTSDELLGHAQASGLNLDL